MCRGVRLSPIGRRGPSPNAPSPHGSRPTTCAQPRPAMGANARRSARGARRPAALSGRAPALQPPGGRDRRRERRRGGQGRTGERCPRSTGRRPSPSQGRRGRPRRRARRDLPGRGCPRRPPRPPRAARGSSGPERPQPRRSSSVAAASRAGLKRRDARLEPAQDRARAGDRHLLRDDDCGEAGEAGIAPAQRRGAADVEEPSDKFGIFPQQCVDGGAKASLVGDRWAGMIEPPGRLRRRPACARRRLVHPLVRHAPGHRSRFACLSVRPDAQRPHCILDTPIPRSSTSVWPRRPADACCCVLKTSIEHAASPLTRRRSLMISRGSTCDSTGCRGGRASMATTMRRRSSVSAREASSTRASAAGRRSRAPRPAAIPTAPRSMRAVAAPCRRRSGEPGLSAGKKSRGGWTWSCDRNCRARTNRLARVRRGDDRSASRWPTQPSGATSSFGDGPRRKLSSGGDGRRRAPGRDRRHPRPGSPRRDLRPSPASGAAWPARAALSSPSSRARRRRRQAVEEPPFSVACRLAGKRRSRRRRLKGRLRFSTQARGQLCRRAQLILAVIPAGFSIASAAADGAWDRIWSIRSRSRLNGREHLAVELAGAGELDGHRVDEVAVDDHLIVQMRSRREASLPEIADDLALGDARRPQRRCGRSRTCDCTWSRIRWRAGSRPGVRSRIPIPP